MSSTVQKGAAATPAQFSDLGPDAGVGGGQEMSLNLILDVAVALLQLAPGAIVELDRKAGEPLDVLVNGVRIARGELVVVDEKFGIRLTDVVSASERMEQVR